MTTTGAAPAGTAALDSAAVRALLPATQAVAYLNTGTAGPLPEHVGEVMRQAADTELRSGRAGMQAYLEFSEHAAALRSALATALGAGPDEIALTRSTTEGMNIVICGLDWKPGDVVVTTNVEHGGALIPLFHLHQRHGVTIEFADCLSGDPEQILASMAAAIRPGVRLVVASHVAYGTGAVLPVREIAELAHEAGALVLVDGAQSVGALPVDFRALGADFYAFPGQKWLCGPEGTGALYVSAACQDVLHPTYVGFGGIDHDRFRPGDPGSLALADGARRYEQGTFYRPAIRGFSAAFSWIAGEVGLPAVTGQVALLRNHCLGRLSEVPGIQVLAPAGNMAGLVAFRHPGLDPAACVAHLAGHGVSVRSVADTGAIRISCGFYNTAGEIDRAVGLVADFLTTSQ